MGIFKQGLNGMRKCAMERSWGRISKQQELKPGNRSMASPTNTELWIGHTESYGNLLSVTALKVFSVGTDMI